MIKLKIILVILFIPIFLLSEEINLNNMTEKELNYTIENINKYKLNKSEFFFKVYNIYYQGKYKIRKNKKKAFKYLQKSANLNCEKAILILSDVYLYGSFKQKSNPKKSFLTLLKIAKTNNIAKIKLGIFYEKGVYVNKDLSKSIMFFKQAAKNKNYDAIQKLEVIAVNGEIYGYSDNTKKNIFFFLNNL